MSDNTSGARRRLITLSTDAPVNTLRMARECAAEVTVFIASRPGERPDQNCPSISLAVEPDGRWKVVQQLPGQSRQDVAAGVITEHVWYWPQHTVGPFQSECQYAGLVVGDPAEWAPGGDTCCPCRTPGSEAVWGPIAQATHPGRLFHLDRVVDLLKERGIADVYVEEVGGGEATIHIGHDPETDLPELTAGPGWFEDTGAAYGVTTIEFHARRHDDLDSLPEYRWGPQPGDDEEAIAAGIADLLATVRKARQP